MNALRQQVMEAVEQLASAVRRGDWGAAEDSDRAVREAVLAMAAASEDNTDEVRETLTVAHGRHLEALEQARVVARSLRARIDRAGIGRQAHRSYQHTAVL